METELKRLHYKSNILKRLCIHTNDMSVGKIGTDLPNGWHVVEAEYNQKTNFKCMIYRNKNQVVFSFAGTDKKSILDHAANLQMCFSTINNQMKKANEFFQVMKRRYVKIFDEVTFVGHSEGGSEATFAGVLNNIETVTFNAYGISKKLILKDKDYNNLITNYRTPHDIVSKLRINPGRTFIIPSDSGFLRAHSIKNMGNCLDAIPVEIYKKKHFLFR